VENVTASIRCNAVQKKLKAYHTTGLRQTVNLYRRTCFIHSLKYTGAAFETWN